jgi:hypothetical protein
MKLVKLLKTFISVAAAVMFAISTSWGEDLTAYRWKNRVLLAFSPTESDPGFVAFNRSLANRTSEVIDRDLVVLRLFENVPSQTEKEPIDVQVAEKLRRRFGVKPGFLTVILIGKDGGVKMVREREAKIQEIFDLIDTMPMRRQEMRNQVKGQ